MHNGPITRRAREATAGRRSPLVKLWADPVPESLAPTWSGRFWRAAVPAAYLVEAPARSRLGLVALMCAIALFASSCWTGTIVDQRQVSFPQTPSAGKNSDQPRRYPSQIHTRDCLNAMERLASWNDTSAGVLESCLDADDYWYCSFVERQRLWYELSAYAYRVVDDCAPEAWKGLLP